MLTANVFKACTTQKLPKKINFRIQNLTKRTEIIQIKLRNQAAQEKRNRANFEPDVYSKYN